MPITFRDLGLRPELVSALTDSGIVEAFPIQAAAIPDALAGRDVCGKAKTGSGKTLAFGLPLIERTPQADPGRPRSLVLAPTRELARQIADVLRPLAKVLGVRLGVFYGGTNVETQAQTLRKRVDIVVATPGRLIDLCERKMLDLADIDHVVLDEADRMADMGFLPQVEWLLRKIDRPHQTWLFSATLDGEIDYLVRRYLRDPVRHELAEGERTVEEMEHRFLGVHKLDRVKVLAAIAQGTGRTIAFLRTKRGVDRLVTQLNDEGVRAAAVHGDLRQGAREKAVGDFTSGRVPLLVATDVAARGLDIAGVDVVVHFDPPEDEKAYTHRSGRTARAGEAGIAVTFVLWDQHNDVDRLKRRLGITEPTVEVFSNDPRLADLSTLTEERARRQAVS